MDNREFIVHLEKVNIKKIDDNTINFTGLFTINGRTQPISRETTKLSNPIESGNEKLTYAAFDIETAVEKRQSLMLQVYYLDIQNEPHVRTKYMEFEGQERIITYPIQKENELGDYKVIPPIENYHREG
jgi:hypothetical protein